MTDQLFPGASQDRIVSGPNIAENSLAINFKDHFVDGVDDGLEAVLTFAEAVLDGAAFGDEGAQGQTGQRDDEGQELEHGEVIQIFGIEDEHHHRT